MLTHPTLDKLRTLRLTGMVQAFLEQQQLPEIHTLSFEERLGLLVDRELTRRDQRRLSNRLRQARLRQPATLEDIDYTTPRGLDKALMARLSTGHWIAEHLNCLITGPTGIGKSWLACALTRRPTAKAIAHATCGYPGCARSWRWPKAMAGMSKSWRKSPKSTCWCWTTGGWLRSPRSSAATSWRYSMIGMAGAPRW